MRVPDSAEHIVPEQSFLLITGAPASGKSSLARFLAASLPDFALISKDALKEALHDTLAAELCSGDAESASLALSRRLSGAAMELLWTVARGCPRVILEANFRPHSAHERERIAALPGRKLELYCHCRPKEAMRRFALRAGRHQRHPAHSLQTMSAEMLAEYNQPVGICPVIPVNTNRPVNRAQVLAAIHDEWPDISYLSGDRLK